DLKINKGDFHGLIGPNGSGKSTFFKLLSQMMDPTLLRDSDFKINRKYRNDIGILFYPLFVFAGTVDENINFGKKIDDDLMT
ncbi:MAG TPA: cysteine ABC transporter ATP-binding protein, partial [Bacteroidales bacterium]|nr:cysteine ABC transporter ATP-binding protein [Bacteroidales bacterium]